MREVSAIEVLERGSHDHLIRILRHGWLDSEVICYFIDMELCEKNLHAFIYEDLDTTDLSCAEHFAVDHCPPIWFRPREILGVIFQLVSGVEYIHKKGQVHRDLKPTNGNITSVSVFRADGDSAILG